MYIDPNIENCKPCTVDNLAGNLGEISLTQREAVCMVHIMKGKTAKEIGKEMNISHRTVETYIEKIKRKTGCWTRSKLVSYGFESGFVRNIL